MIDKEFSLSSPAFKHNGLIPKIYTSDGENISPPLVVSNIPDGTKSLALIVDDPDAATDPDGPGHTYVHWVVFNIPPQVSIFSEGSVPEGAIQGVNSSGSPGYIGPAPPNGEHRYFLKLYALKNELDLDENATSEAVEAAAMSSLVAQAELVGRYSRLERVGE